MRTYLFLKCKCDTAAPWLLIFIFATLFLFAAVVKSETIFSDSKSDVQDAAIDGIGSSLFLLHRDSAVSIYDAKRKEFRVVRRRLDAVTNGVAIRVSPDGQWVALINGGAAGGDPAELIILPAAQLAASSDGADKLFRSSLGSIRGAASSFAPDGKLFIIANTTQGKLQVFNPAQRSNYEVETGRSPIGFAFNSPGTMLFVANQESNDISVIDLAGKKLVATIPVGNGPSAISFNSRLNRVFVSNVASASVSVIDAGSLKILRDIPVGNQPGSLAADGGGLVYAANNSDGTISIIAPDFSVKTLDIKAPAYHQSAPIRLFASKQLGRIFILNQTAAQYFVYDVLKERIIKQNNTNTWPRQLNYGENSQRVFIRHFDAPILAVDLASLVEEQIPEAPGATEQKIKYFSSPQSIAVDEDTNQIYVSNLGSGALTVIDGQTQKPISVIKDAAEAPQVLRLDFVTKKLYITNPVGNTITVIDTKDKQYPKKIIPVGKMPRGITINEATGKVYVSNSGEKSVSVLDGRSGDVPKAVDLGAQSNFPLVLQVNPRKNEIYAVNYGGNTLAVIDGKTDTLKRNVITGRNPIWVRYLQGLDQIYVSVESEKKVIRINPDTYEIAEAFELAKRPYRIFFDETAGLLYVNHRKDETVTVIRPASSQSGKGAIIAEKTIPYLGQTDTVYNMWLANQKTQLAYVTYGSRNKVMVLKLNRSEQDGILNPVWFATIQPDGSVLYNPAFQPEAGRPRFTSQIYFLIGTAIALLGLIALAYKTFFRRRQPVV